MTDLLMPPKPLAGQLRFVHYAFMPNRLQYCGGDDNRTLLDYGTAEVVDPGLTPLLRRFTGALPYLRLIAGANGIADPFDSRVVEAYWLGNELLEGVEAGQLYDSLAERFGKQVAGSARQWLLSKAPAGARPHHNFHVFDIHSRVGEVENTLATMDGCRISGGKVLAVEGTELVVERQPLIQVEGKLALGPTQRTRVVRQVDARGFADAARPGDWVALHWGWVCEVITPRQQANLAHYTQYHLAIANQTI